MISKVYFWFSTETILGGRAHKMSERKRDAFALINWDHWWCDDARPRNNWQRQYLPVELANEPSSLASYYTSSNFIGCGIAVYTIFSGFSTYDRIECCKGSAPWWKLPRLHGNMDQTSRWCFALCSEHWLCTCTMNAADPLTVEIDW
jgi:hypothetical protein